VTQFTVYFRSKKKVMEEDRCEHSFS